MHMSGMTRRRCTPCDMAAGWFGKYDALVCHAKGVKSNTCSGSCRASPLLAWMHQAGVPRTVAATHCVTISTVGIGEPDHENRYVSRLRTLPTTVGRKHARQVPPACLTEG